MIFLAISSTLATLAILWTLLVGMGVLPDNEVYDLCWRVTFIAVVILTAIGVPAVAW